MTVGVKLTGATSNIGSHWKSINWNKVKADIKRLQMRIAKAVREGKPNRVKLLQLDCVVSSSCAMMTSWRRQRLNPTQK